MTTTTQNLHTITESELHEALINHGFRPLCTVVNAAYYIRGARVVIVGREDGEAPLSDLKAATALHHAYIVGVDANDQIALSFD